MRPGLDARAPEIEALLSEMAARHGPPAPKATEPSPPSWEQVVASLDHAGREAFTATAYHEAGHFVAAYLTGSGLSYAEVRPDGAGSFRGAVAFPAKRQGWAPDTVSAAGYVAELLAGCDPTAAESHARSDWVEAEREQIEAGRSIDFSRATRAARFLLNGHWPAVEAVARELMKHGRVEGPEVRKMLDGLVA